MHPWFRGGKTWHNLWLVYYRRLFGQTSLDPNLLNSKKFRCYLVRSLTAAIPNLNCKPKGASFGFALVCTFLRRFAAFLHKFALVSFCVQKHISPYLTTNFEKDRKDPKFCQIMCTTVQPNWTLPCPSPRRTPGPKMNQLQWKDCVGTCGSVVQLLSSAEMYKMR